MEVQGGCGWRNPAKQELVRRMRDFKLIGSQFRELMSRETIMASWLRRYPAGLLFVFLFAVLQLCTATVSALAGEQASEAEILKALQAKRLMRCPQTHSGCSEAQPEKPRLDIEIAFDYASSELRPSARSALLKLGGALGKPAIKDGGFLIAGYTDAKGGESYNQRLSERRAEAVKRFLMTRFHLPAEKLKVVGFGKTELKSPASPFAHENRRVQVMNMSAG
jgi:outer membrane protein OmpA-like peptidoglycan-associated protein